MSDIIITICGRAGSKGIPGKNIKLLNGLPLITYSIKTAKKFSAVSPSDIVLSTDDPLIKDTAKNYGLYDDYVRPGELATDKAGKIDVIKDVLFYYEAKLNKRYDFIIDLDITSPLRTIEDISEALFYLKKVDSAVNIFSVSPAKRNPYFNMVEEKKDGFFRLVLESKIIKSRQEAPKIYDMNASFGIFRRIFFDKAYETCTTDKSLAYVIPHVCFDLDEPEDFSIMEILLRENILGIEI